MSSELETILSHIAAPETQSGFKALLDKSDNVNLAKLIDEVDQSDYSLIDWVEALLGFDEWLVTNKPEYVDRDFDHIVGYLHCCQMTTSDNLSKPNMRNVVNECLNDFGYEPSVGLQS